MGCVASRWGARQEISSQQREEAALRDLQHLKLQVLGMSLAGHSKFSREGRIHCAMIAKFHNRLVTTHYGTSVFPGKKGREKDLGLGDACEDGNQNRNRNGEDVAHNQCARNLNEFHVEKYEVNGEQNALHDCWKIPEGRGLGERTVCGDDFQEFNVNVIEARDAQQDAGSDDAFSEDVASCGDSANTVVWESPSGSLTSSSSLSCSSASCS